MPAFSATYGAYNVQASLNQWFVKNITANGVPAWMPSAQVKFDWSKEKPLFSGYSGSVFTLVHLTDTEVGRTQGKRADNGTAATLKAGQMDISCWVDKQASPNTTMARLRIMRDMVSRILQQQNEVMLTNVYGSTGNAPGVTALVRFDTDGPEFQPPQTDAINPDVWRIRGVVGYEWWERDG